jgi:uncharacterized membrane protein YfcA
MKRHQAGSVNLLALAGVMPTFLIAIGGQASLEYAGLKDGPTDTRQLYALIICFVAGCIAQFSYLLAHIGDDVPRPPGRWVGEILFGGFAAYIGCVAFLNYGPVVDLPQLIVPAVVGGFLGQRLLFGIVEYVTKRFNLPSIKWVAQTPPPPPVLPPPTPPPPGGEQDGP